MDQSSMLFLSKIRYEHIVYQLRNWIPLFILCDKFISLRFYFSRRWILSYKSVAVFTISLCSEYVKTDMKIFTQICQLFIN